MRKTHWIILWLAALTAVAALLVGALIPTLRSTHADQPNVDPSAPRIVTLSPAIAVILDDLGLADHIVGRHAFDMALDSAIPIVGDMNGIDYEQLLRLKPTHVLLEVSARALPDRLLNLAHDHGWIIESVPMLTLNDIPQAVTLISGLFDSREIRERRTALLTEFTEAMKPSPKIAQRAGRVLALYWTNPVGAAGPGSFHYEMLKRLGFQLALEEGGPFITMDPEDVLRMDPDSILLLMPGADPDRLDELLGPLSKLNLRCVREGRVGVINDPMVNLPATSITRVVREILEKTAQWPPPAAN